MINDSDYLIFVDSYNNGFNAGTEVWWENNIWLNNSNNFNLDIENGTGPYDELTSAEKALVKEFPVQAWEIKQNIDPAFAMAQIKFGDYPPYFGFERQKRWISV